MELKELVTEIDIVEFIGQYVELEEKNGEWWGISPFTFPPEKTPSFSVNPPFFYDYSAGFGGNAFSFIVQYKGCSTAEAVDELKRFVGYDGEVGLGSNSLSATKIFKKYAGNKRQEKESSGVVLDKNYMDRYERNSDKLSVWVDEGISPESLERFQVRYDAFSDRLVYPIHDIDGRIVNVGGRALDPEWKERGQRKYCYFFSWGYINTIYGLYENMNEILKKREVVIFEGCKSVLLADTWGIKNTSAILTSHLSYSQMTILAKLGCNVVFALDKEIRVRDDKNIQMLKRYVNVYYLWDRDMSLDEKDAPVDKGKDVFISLYNGKLKLR